MKDFIIQAIVLLLIFCASLAHAQSSVPDVVSPDCQSVQVTDYAGNKSILIMPYIKQQLTNAQRQLMRDSSNVIADDTTIAMYTPPLQELAACRAALNAQTTNTATSTSTATQ